MTTHILTPRSAAPKTPDMLDSAGSSTKHDGIHVRDLNIYYGDFLAVRGVNVDIAPQSITALIGPSGCGKSTFLRSLNRMHEVVPGARVDGTVVIGGENIYGVGADPRGRPLPSRHGVPTPQSIPDHEYCRQCVGWHTAKQSQNLGK